MSKGVAEPGRCPLCGRDNQCGMAQDAETCWCSGVTIPAEVLERVPADAAGRVCVCPECALGPELSPCTQVCELDQATQTCRGCRRTMKEIMEWAGYSTEERLAVLRHLGRPASAGPRISARPSEEDA